MQLLWVNLIMDTMGALGTMPVIVDACEEDTVVKHGMGCEALHRLTFLALAALGTETPSETLLDRKPYLQSSPILRYFAVFRCRRIIRDRL